jgi:hypothetical protein
MIRSLGNVPDAGGWFTGREIFMHSHKEAHMPLFMDIHRNAKGLSADDLAKAHQKDLEVQSKYKVKYLNYWYNESEGAIFCLCDAPDKQAANAVHKEAHGAVADEIIEVKAGQ